MKAACVRVVCAAAAIAVFSAVPAMSQMDAPPVREALDGADPVILLTEGKEVFGKQDLRVVRGRFAYLFSTAESKAAFEKAPEKFEIQLNGACARMGAVAGGNPSDFLVHDGKIYIFGSDDCHKKFAAAPAKFLPRVPAPMPDGAGAREAGRALIGRAVASIGGGTRLDGLTSYVESWSQVQKRPSGDVTVAVRTTWRFPAGVRMERSMTMPDRKVTNATVFTPEGAWFDGGPGRVYPMSADAIPTLQQDYGRQLIPLLRARTDPAFEAAAIGTRTIDGITVEQVRVRRGPVDVTLGLDAASGDVRTLTFVGRNSQSEFGEYTLLLSDYRTVDGLRLPFTERALYNGTPDDFLSRQLEAIAANVPIDASLFAPSTGATR
jgi:YHS domain-containing protein